MQKKKREIKVKLIGFQVRYFHWVASNFKGDKIVFKLIILYWLCRFLNLVFKTLNSLMLKEATFMERPRVSTPVCNLSWTQSGAQSANEDTANDSITAIWLFSSHFSLPSSSLRHCGVEICHPHCALPKFLTHKISEHNKMFVMLCN